MSNIPPKKKAERGIEPEVFIGSMGSISLE
jgi:hypothetical protein